MTEVPSERRASAAATVAIAAMIAELVAGRAVRDAMFLSTLGAARLPYMMIAAALVSLAALLVASRAMARRSPTRVVVVALTASATLLFLQWLLTWRFGDLVAVSLYLHLAVFGPVLTSGYWSLVNERFDPHTAKRYMGKLGAGATFGGVVGGVVTSPISALFGVDVLLLLLAGFHVIAAASVVVFVRATQRPPVTGVERRQPESAIAALRVPYLRHLAGFVMMIAFSSALVDYTLRATAASVFLEEATLLRFFAAFYTVTAVLAFAVQSGFGGASLGRLGLAGTVALLPASILFSGGLTLWLPALVRAVVMRGFDVVLQSSLYRSGYELFYTPVAASRKRGAKLLIDVGADRAGQALGSGLVLALVTLLPAWAALLVVIFAMASSALALLLTLRLHRGYVGALESSLVAQSIGSASETSGEWSATAVWETSQSLRREELLRVLSSEKLDVASLDERRDPAVEVAPPGGAATTVEADPFLVAAAGLRSGDPARVRSVLTRAKPLDVSLVPLLIPLLADDDLLADVVTSLRGVGNRAAGVLVDHLLSHDVPFVVQRRLPRVLQVCDSPTAVSGLFTAVRLDRRLAVRWHASRALVRMPTEVVTQVITRAAVLERVRHELANESGIPLADVAMEGAWEAKRERDAMRLEHVLNLLALVLDKEPLRLAQRAFRSGGRATRGTALEYLDNVLPPDLFQGLRDLAGAGTPSVRSQRSREQMVADLQRSTRASVDDDA